MTLPILPPNPEWGWYVEGVRLYAAMLRTRTPFAQANYGDGEWACILGEDGENVNGERYVPELRHRLSQTLREAAGIPVWYGMNPGKRQRSAASAWMEAAGVDVPIVFKEHLSAANVNGQLGPFFRALRDRHTVVVGGPHLADLPVRVIGSHEHVEVTASRAWTETERVLEDISRVCVISSSTILFAAGMGTNLMIHQLAKRYPLRSGAWIDVGACLDPYCGVFSRKGYRTQSFKEDAIERNLR